MALRATEGRAIAGNAGQPDGERFEPSQRKRRLGQYPLVRFRGRHRPAIERSNLRNQSSIIQLMLGNSSGDTGNFFTSSGKPATR